MPIEQSGPQSPVGHMLFYPRERAVTEAYRMMRLHKAMKNQLSVIPEHRVVCEVPEDIGKELGGQFMQSEPVVTLIFECPDFGVANVVLCGGDQKRYLTHQQTQQYIDYLEKTFADTLASLSDGQSHEA